MTPREIEYKIEIEYKKIEEENRILTSLAKIFNSYLENLQEIKNSDQKTYENSLTKILTNKKKLEEFVFLFRERPEDFPRMHFPSLINTMQTVLNHATNILAKKMEFELNEPMIREIGKICKKEPSVKINKLLKDHTIQKTKNNDNEPVKHKALTLEDQARNNELLLIAAEAGLVQVVRDLLRQGGDPKIVADQAAISGHMCLFYLLKEINKEVLHYKPDAEWNLFHAAVSAGHVNVVQFLLDNNVKENIINLIDIANGYAPLHYAVENYHEPIVALLINYGVDVNLKNKQGKTALQIALQLHKRYKYSEYTSRYFNIIKYLLGVETYVTEEDAEFPLLKSLSSALSVRNNIFNNMAKLEVSSQVKVVIEELKKLIEIQYQKINPEIFGTIGLNLIDTQLLKTVSCCPALIVPLLSISGVNFNLADQFHKTPINLAIELNLWETIVHMLISMPSDNLLHDYDRELLNKHHDELTVNFIDIASKLSMKDKINYLHQVLGTKEAFQKTKPGCALGCILYTPDSPLKLSLFGKEKFRDEKVPHSIYQIVTAFANILTDAP